MRPSWDGVGALVATCVALVVIVVPVSLALWPPTMSATLLALVVLYVAASTHPVLVRHSTRAEFIVMSEMVAAIAVLALSPSDALWVLVAGAVTTPVLVPLLSPLERMRRAPLSRHLLNVSANILSALPMVVLAGLAGPFGAAGVALAALVGLAAHGVISHLLVTAAIHNTTRPPATAVLEDTLWSPISVALAMGGVAVPIGLALRAYQPDWPLLLAVAVTLVTVSRTRMEGTRPPIVWPP